MSEKADAQNILAKIRIAPMAPFAAGRLVLFIASTNKVENNDI